MAKRKKLLSSPFKIGQIFKEAIFWLDYDDETKSVQVSGLLFGNNSFRSVCSQSGTTSALTSRRSGSIN